jgi:hypothetical protein
MILEEFQVFRPVRSDQVGRSDREGEVSKWKLLEQGDATWADKKRTTDDTDGTDKEGTRAKFKTRFCSPDPCHPCDPWFTK